MALWCSRRDIRTSVIPEDDPSGNLHPTTQPLNFRKCSLVRRSTLPRQMIGLGHLGAAARFEYVTQDQVIPIVFRIPTYTAPPPCTSVAFWPVVLVTGLGGGKVRFGHCSFLCVRLSAEAKISDRSLKDGP